MRMPQAAQRWTPAMVRALPDDGNRYEVVAGELFVTPAPSFDHQQAVARLLLRLVPYVDAHGLGYALASPADIEFEEEHEEEHLVQPDIFVAPRLEGRRPERWSDIKRLLLAVEVLSPGTARADRTVKRQLFQRVGVPDYWIVDAAARVVECWRPEESRPEVLSGNLVWRPTPDTPPLEIDLPQLFAEIVEG
jgi:Uma2 family endonuclease